MNGKPGDDPATDILHHQVVVYSPEVDALVRKLAKIVDLRRLQEFLESLKGLPVDAVRQSVVAELQLRREDARARGWEVDE